MIDRTWLVDQGFTGFVSVANLCKSRAIEIPTLSGVYAVLRESIESPDFLPQSIGGHFKGKDPTVSHSILAKSWVHESQVIYIGKAGYINKEPSIQKRVLQYLDFGQGKPIGHWGGRYVWQLADSAELLFAWQATSSDIEPRTMEHDLIAKFERATGQLPFANLKR